MSGTSVPGMKTFDITAIRKKQAERTRAARKRDLGRYSKKRSCTVCGNQKMIPDDNGGRKPCPKCSSGKGRA